MPARINQKNTENKKKKAGFSLSFAVRYALLGALFGLAFPVVATGILLWLEGMPIDQISIIQLQTTRPLLWIIDTAPLFLGLFASFAGRREDKLRRAYMLLQQDEEELQQLTRQLEFRKEQLLVSSAISSRLATILNLEDLLVEVVNEVQEKFGYYHVRIYLFNEETKNLVFAEGSGQAGIQMKKKTEYISLYRSDSLVAQVARRKRVMQIDNVRTSPDWQPDPLLPDTCSQMAVPITLAEQVVGVLEVSEDEIAGLDEGDADLLCSLAGQLAVGIYNARLFTESETALQEARLVQEQYATELWSKTGIALGESQYLYVDPNSAPPDDQEQESFAEIEKRALLQNRPLVVFDEHIKQESLVAPIKLRNRTIGILQLHAQAEGLVWDEDDVTLVNTIIDQIAQTADNLRLFGEAQKTAGREQTIRQVTEHMRSATSLDELLKIAASELGEHLSADYAVVELGVNDETPDETVDKKDREPERSELVQNP
jgi:GAF domain-containing protein